MMIRTVFAPALAHWHWTLPFMTRYFCLWSLMCIFLVASSAFVWRKAFHPSDGARLEPGASAWQAQGVIVTQVGDQAGALHTGDLVIAVAGQPMDAWAQALFRPAAPRPRWVYGEGIAYTVLRNGQTLTVTVTPGRYPLAAMLARNWSILLFALSAQLVTLFILWRRPADVAARALFVWAWSLACSLTWLLGLSVYDLVDGLGFWLFTVTATGAWFLSWGANLHFALLFPQPHWLIVRRPWLVQVVYCAPLALYAIYLAVTRSMAVTTLDWLKWWRMSDWLVAFVYLAAAIVIVIQQYQASRGATRQQIRWLAFAALLSVSGSLFLWFLPGIFLGRPLIPGAALGLIVLPYPLALIFALLRHRLFDIDIIIRRTFVYSILTVILAGVYWSSIMLLQWLFNSFAGPQQNQLATMISTLISVALSRPLHRRVQDVIDRRFYRRAYNSAQVLATFGAAVRNDTNLESLTDRLVLVVEEALQPTAVSVWLREPAQENARQTAAGSQQFPAIVARSPLTGRGRQA